MSLPLLEIKPTTQNQRVEGYDVPDEDDPQAYRLARTADESDVNNLIWAAYRQIFGEHLILESNRQPFLESQLRNRAISVRDFIRGLGKTDTYRELVADTNSNYRLVDITFKRFLGRASYNQQEQISWSIVIATEGLNGFIDAVVDSEEYRQNFGNDIVPYQRRRMEGRPFNLVNPRYSDYWRNNLMSLDLSARSFYQARSYQTDDLDKQVIRQAIPTAFLRMAQSMIVPQVNYQRDVARATSGAVKIPDMSREETSTPKPTVKRSNTALPYRYISSEPKV